MSLSPRQLLVLLTICVLSGTDAACAFAKAVWAAKRRRTRVPADVEATSFVADQLRNASPALLAALERPGYGCRTRLRNAAVYVACFETRAWVQRMNELKSVAPSTAAMATFFVQACERRGVSQAPLARSIANNQVHHRHGRALRKWAASFRNKSSAFSCSRAS